MRHVYDKSKVYNQTENMTISYDTLIEKTKSIEPFLNSISLLDKAKRGRLYFYINLITQLNKAIKDGTYDNFLKKFDHAKCGFALKELREIVFILENICFLHLTINNGHKAEIERKLAHILTGPNFTSHETSANSTARNYQFELLLTARLFSKGLKTIYFFTNPDIHLETNNRKYAIECKRITGDFISLSIQRTEDAIKQLLKLPEGQYFGGIVALDLSSKYEQGSRWLDSKNHDTAENYIQGLLGKDLAHIYQKSTKTKQAAENGRVVALIANVSAVYTLKERKELGWVNEIAFLMFNKELPFREHVILTDFAPLKSK